MLAISLSKFKKCLLKFKRSRATGESSNGTSLTSVSPGRIKLSPMHYVTGCRTLMRHILSEVVFYADFESVSEISSLILVSLKNQKVQKRQLLSA